MKRPTITNPSPSELFVSVASDGLGGVYEVKRMPPWIKRVPKVINGVTLWKCNACGSWKTAAEFAPDKRKSNGLQGDCRSCQNAVARERRHANIEEYRRRTAETRSKDPERYRRYGRESYKRHREKRIAEALAAAKKYPERKRARYAVEQALKTGKLIKPDRCEMCGGSGRLEAHHECYSAARRLIVIWLCMRCHRFVHKQQDELRKRQASARQPRPARVPSSSATRKQPRRRKA